MKNFLSVLLIIGMLVCGFAFNTSAQNKAHRTSSAKAYYGYKPAKPPILKKKKQKAGWVKHHKPAKGTRTDARITRRKFNQS